MRTTEKTANKVFEILRADMSYIGVSDEELYSNIYNAGEGTCLSFLDYCER